MLSGGALALTGCQEPLFLPRDSSCLNTTPLFFSCHRSKRCLRIIVCCPLNLTHARSQSCCTVLRTTVPLRYLVIMSSRRVYIISLVIAASVTVLLLVHHNSDSLPFETPQIWRNSSPDPVPARVLPMCLTADPFDIEYGRTNIRLTRAYEGERDPLADSKPRGS